VDSAFVAEAAVSAQQVAPRLFTTKWGSRFNGGAGSFTRNEIKASLLILGIVLPLFACQAAEKGRASSEAATSKPHEYKVEAIPLLGKLANEWAEVSGLAWYREHLIILPQYPDRFSSEADGRIFSISKERIQAFLDGNSKAPILPHEIPFVAVGVEEGIKGFEGYEAIAFKGNRVFMSIESKPGEQMMGYLISGEIAPDLSAIRLNPGSLREMPPRAHLENMSEEALLVVKDRVVSLHEANGANVNSNPSAYIFDLSLRTLGTIAFPRIEYRITDATSPDSEGRFWVINFLYSGDRAKLKPAPDAWAAIYGLGPSHSRSATVERLVELRYTGTQISANHSAPIQLELLGDGRARNWEGVVRLDQKGFLLMTDRYPETILGFVSAQ
jgi:hypothetical protein